MLTVAPPVPQVSWYHTITHLVISAFTLLLYAESAAFLCHVCDANSMPVGAHLGISACGLTPQTPVMTPHQIDNANMFSLAGSIGRTSSGIMP